VVAEFEFRLHPVTDIYGGPMAFEVADAADVLRYFDAFIADAPRGYGGFPGWRMAAPIEVWSSHWQNSSMGGFRAPQAATCRLGDQSSATPYRPNCLWPQIRGP